MNCQHNNVDEYQESCDDCGASFEAIRKERNGQRAQYAEVALRTYVESKGEVYERSSSEIVDLITDLLHLTAHIDEGDEPIESAVRLALMHFDAETLGDHEG